MEWRIVNFDFGLYIDTTCTCNRVWPDLQRKPACEKKVDTREMKWYIDFVGRMCPLVNHKLLVSGT